MLKSVRVLIFYLEKLFVSCYLNIRFSFNFFSYAIRVYFIVLNISYYSSFKCRSCLIAMSLMMGCDYYQKGIPGVGVVTALEIVSEFYVMQQDHPQVILDRFKLVHCCVF